MRHLAEVQDSAGDELGKARLQARLFGLTPAAPRIGRFTVLEQIGAGAMGVVYAAYDGELDRKVAIKLLRPEVSDAERAGRFAREARALARLSHPNVVAVHEVGTWKGRPFIAMEFVKGQTLRAWQEATPRPWSALIRAYLAAGEGMAAAHGEGLVHRDFKPDNVLVGDDGRVRVADFGLARAAGERTERDPGTAPAPAPLAAPVTRTGAVVGTPAYMAPEQLLGGQVDARADQFSFCVALYEALYGCRPFAGEDLMAIARAANAGDIAVPPASGNVPPRVWRVLARGLAAAPAERWPSMDALLQALARAAWPARRWRWRLGLAGLLALGVAAWLVAHLAIERSRARSQALAAELAQQRTLAQDARLVSAASRLIELDPTAAARALAEVRYPSRAAGWLSMATSVLQQPLSRTVLQAQDMAIYDMAVSPDGRYIAGWSRHGRIRVWRADGTGLPIELAPHPALSGTEPIKIMISPDSRALLVHVQRGVLLVYQLGGEPTPQAFADGAAEVLAAQWSADGLGVHVLMRDGTTGLWQPGQPLVPGRRISEPPASAFSARFLPGGTQLAYWLPGPDIRIVLWSLQDSRPPVIFSGAADRPGSSAVWDMTPDGRYLAVGKLDPAGGKERDVWLWHVDAPRLPVRLRGHKGRIRAVAFSPDGRLLLTTCEDFAVRIWRVGEASEPVVLRGHTAAIRSAAFSPDGRRVVTAANDRTARVWELSEQGRVWTLRGHRHSLMGASFTNRDEQVATMSADGTVRVWDLSPRQSITLRGHEGPIWSASLDPGGTRLATAAHDGTARVWDLGGREPPVVLRGHTGTQVYSAVFSPDGLLVATGGNDGTARAWQRTGAPVAVLQGHEDWAYSLAFSPDGQQLFTGSRRGQIRQWTWDTAGRVRLLGQSPRPARLEVINLLLPTPDGTAITAATSHGNVLVWSAASQREQMLVRSAGEHTVMAYSPDQTRLAVGMGDGTVQLLDARTHALLGAQRAHSVWIDQVAFSPDSRRFATASLDGTARVWDRDMAGAPLVLYGHEDWVTKVAFDATGEWLITASYDHTARIWNLADPDNPIVLRGHEAGLRFAAFTPDGRAVTASQDSTVRIWSIDLYADASALHAQLGRATTMCLGMDQRRQFLGEAESTASARTLACERAYGRAR